MKKIISYALLGGILLGIVPSTSFAMARYIMPPWGGTQFKADDNSKTFVYFDSMSGKETIVFKPEFSGNIKDFGIIIPVPAKPEVSETSKSIFDSLEIETNQPRYNIQPYVRVNGDVQAVSAVVQEKRVEIIDVKDVGEYQTVTVKANDADVFKEWLSKYKFALDADTKKALSFYTAKKDWYFVLIRGHMTPWEDKLKDPTKIEKGTLSPISITFNTKKPMLPWRIMGGQLPLSKATVYVASREVYYIPQTDIQFASRMEEYTPTTNDTITPITDYQYRNLFNLSNMTLIRHALVFNPKKITEDLYFAKGTSAIDMIPNTERKAVTIKTPLSKGLGILPSKARIFSTNGAYNGFIHSVRVLEMGDKGIMITGLQEFLVSQGVLIYEKNKKPDGTFNQKTEDALVQFQSNNGLTQTGVTDPDTKKFILDLLRKASYPPIYY